MNIISTLEYNDGILQLTIVIFHYTMKYTSMSWEVEELCSNIIRPEKTSLTFRAKPLSSTETGTQRSENIDFATFSKKADCIAWPTNIH